MSFEKAKPSGVPSGEGVLPLADRLALAQKLFDEQYPRCFWSWDRHTRITEDLLPGVAHALRNQGGRREFLLSTKLCSSMIYRQRYLPSSADTAAPKAT
jgi:hypothetical protein